MTAGGAIPRHKTALTRTSLSRPLVTALADLFDGLPGSVFDFGCGRGDDLRHLRALGCDAEGWDPVHRPTPPLVHADLVNLGYVVNVIESPRERSETLRRAWGLADRVLVVAARLDWEGRDLPGQPLSDGVLTRTGTFQKFFEQTELGTWIADTLGAKPYAAAPGIYYVFRQPEDAQRFLATRVYSYRPRVTVSPHDRYAANEDALAPLLAFMQQHARPPKSTELSDDAERAIVEAFGSLRRAERLVRHVTESKVWDQVALQRRCELLVYIALSRLTGRPRFVDLDQTLAADIRAQFNSYRDACLQADRLLLACGDQPMILVDARASKVGKQTPSALYVHRSAVGELAPVLQVYEGCARALSGTVEHANMVKLSVREPQVSFLSYPEFGQDAHPTLRSAVTVNLRRLSVEWHDYRDAKNPPLLHRKEEFLGADHPRRPLYERLTKAEIRAGLYESPEQIGTVVGWRNRLDECRVEVRGHRLVKLGR